MKFAFLILCGILPTLICYSFAGAILYRDGSSAYTAGWIGLLGIGTAMLFRGPTIIEFHHVEMGTLDDEQATGDE